MRSPPTAAAFALLLAGCSSAEPPGPGNDAAAPGDAGEAPLANSAVPAGPAWDLVASGEGDALILDAASGERALSFFCPARRAELLVNVPAFRPVGSEERMTFGSGGEAATLVADTSGDAGRGGVSGTGAVPANLGALLGGPVAVNYGAQNSGPHPAPPAELVSGFTAACTGKGGGGAPQSPAPVAKPVGELPKTPSKAPDAGAGAGHPCRMQGERRLVNPPLRAIGTEPFWNARTHGRCVTYSHPEDQAGTRLWTGYRPAPNGAGTWTGALEGRRFELTIRPRPGCSDGMSDRRYPFEAELRLGGEVRRGCAEPG